MSLQTSRRAILAGLAAAPVAGLPALAEPNSALAMAIGRHRVAMAAYNARPDENDETIDRLLGAANVELDALIETPCASDGELIEKLRYLLDYWLRVTDRVRSYRHHEFGDLVDTLDRHFNPAEFA